MPPGPTPGEPVERDLEAELDAERAATDHWRRVARQRSAEYAELRHRTSIRALLAAERRLAPLRQPIAAAMERAEARAARIALRARAFGHHPDRHLLALRTAVARLPPAPEAPRSFDLIEVDPARSGPAHETVAEVRRAIAATDAPVILVMLGSADPLEAGWHARMLAALDGDVVAATAVLVHPARAAAFATPHDGLVRAAGLSLGLDAAGVPTVVARDAGTVADPEAPVHEVDAVSGVAFAVTRAAYQDAGGLPLADDLDVAAVELSCALRARGGRIVVVPGGPPGRSHRPSARWPTSPARSTPRLGRGAPRSIVPVPCSCGRYGRSTTRSGSSSPWPRRRTRSPPAGATGTWPRGWPAACAGWGTRSGSRPPRTPTNRRAGWPTSTSCCGVCNRFAAAPGQRHVLWIISHPESIEDDELDAADLVLVASHRFAEHLRSRTATPVDVFLQATDHRRFFPRPVDPAHSHPVTFVGKTRDVLRPVVRDALEVGIRPAIYGGGWRALVDPRLVVADHVDNEDLPVVYSSAGVVLNDHWRTMQTWGFVSNRLFDVLACGIPVISDPVMGLSTLFDGCVLEYDAPAQLRRLVDEVLTDPTTARARAERGRKLVVAGHTFDHRAQELVRALTKVAPIT